MKIWINYVYKNHRKAVCQQATNAFSEGPNTHLIIISHWRLKYNHLLEPWCHYVVLQCKQQYITSRAVERCQSHRPADVKTSLDDLCAVVTVQTQVCSAQRCTNLQCISQNVLLIPGWGISVSTAFIPDHYYKVKVSRAPLCLCMQTQNNSLLNTWLKYCKVLCFLSENEDPNCVAGLCFCGCDQCSTCRKQHYTSWR